MMQYPKIDFTCTTFNRLNMFIDMMDSFLDTCLDLDLISNWYIGDDGSPERDLAVMKEKYSFIKILKNPKKGQGSNLNYLWSYVKTPVWFHCEDDWLFIKRDNYIRKLFDVMNDDKKIKNAILRYWEVGEKKTTRSGVKYNIHIHSLLPNKHQYDDSHWCGYSLNPGLQDKETVHLLGKYDESHRVDSREWDRPQARKFNELGFKRANLLEKYIEHIGEGKSAYEIRRDRH